MPFFIARQPNGSIYFESVDDGHEVVPIIPTLKRGQDVVGIHYGGIKGPVAIQMKVGGGVTMRPNDVLHGDYGAAVGTWEADDLIPIYHSDDHSP